MKAGAYRSRAAGQTASLADRLRWSRILAVVTIDEPKHAAPLAVALQSGGVDAVEVTLRNPLAFEAIQVMRQAAPRLLIGAGTALNPLHVNAARKAGADFALAPGFDAATVLHCAAIGFDFIPGVGTASEVQMAAAHHCRLLKLFPVCALGGISGLRALTAPFAHLGVEWVPLGGIDARTAPEYAAEASVAAIGGSWIAPRELIRGAEWAAIRRNAQEAIRLVAPVSSS
jgi:2-dehydro-3-deoxyphosphogluconate aldolase/(4S)-4-hydroxy-2-oxoglutarate aldolase